MIAASCLLQTPGSSTSEFNTNVNRRCSRHAGWAVTNPEHHESHASFIVYGASKDAVSMLTVQYAKAVPEIKFNPVEPGFTSTDLTGNGDGQPPSAGAEVIAAVAHDRSRRADRHHAGAQRRAA